MCLAIRQFHKLIEALKYAEIEKNYHIFTLLAKNLRSHFNFGVLGAYRWRSVTIKCFFLNSGGGEFCFKDNFFSLVIKKRLCLHILAYLDMDYMYQSCEAGVGVGVTQIDRLLIIILKIL